MEEWISWINEGFFLTAVVEWFCCLCCILAGKKKRPGISLALISVGMFLLQNLVVYVSIAYAPTYEFLPLLAIRMPVYLFLMWLFLFLCVDGTKEYITYVFCKTFLWSELIWSFVWYFRKNIEFPEGETLLYGWLVIPLAFAVMALVQFGFERAHAQQVEEALTRREMRNTLLLSVSVFFVATVFFGVMESNIGILFDISHTSADFIGLMLIYSYQDAFLNKKMQQELCMIGKVMEEQKNQYLLSQENIAVINQKYHDIKHLFFLAKNGAGQESFAWMNGIEQEIQDFEAWKKTGNQVLDTILTDKHLYCIRHQIELTCVIDGECLGRMREADICTIFGNMLSNAIECVEQIEDCTKRLIHVTVFEKQGFLNMSFDNVFEQELHFRGNFPVTTKGDENYHGYGLKSVSYTVKKYEGHLTVRTNENWFEGRILIPLPLRVQAAAS